MLYTFYAGIRILSTENYSALTDAERTEARTALFNAIRPVLDGMGTFETSNPDRYLEGILAAAADGTWGRGATFVDGVWYYVHPVSGEVICVRDHDLLRNSAPFTTSVTVAGKVINAGFFNRQTAINPQ